MPPFLEDGCRASLVNGEPKLHPVQEELLFQVPRVHALHLEVDQHLLDDVEALARSLLCSVEHCKQAAHEDLAAAVRVWHFCEQIEGFFVLVPAHVDEREEVGRDGAQAPVALGAHDFRQVGLRFPESGVVGRPRGGARGVPLVGAGESLQNAAGEGLDRGLVEVREVGVGGRQAQGLLSPTRCHRGAHSPIEDVRPHGQPVLIQLGSARHQEQVNFVRVRARREERRREVPRCPLRPVPVPGFRGPWPHRGGGSRVGPSPQFLSTGGIFVAASVLDLEVAVDQGLGHPDGPPREPRGEAGVGQEQPALEGFLALVVAGRVLGHREKLARRFAPTAPHQEGEEIRSASADV